MHYRGDVKSGYERWLLHNLGRNSGVPTWGTNSGGTGSI